MQLPTLRLLATPPEASQQLPRMAGKVLSAEPSVDHLGHVLEGPEVRPVPGGQGAPEEHLDQRTIRDRGWLSCSGSFGEGTSWTCNLAPLSGCLAGASRRSSGRGGLGVG